jgi:thiol:disulfide interchange protein DsbD
MLGLAACDKSPEPAPTQASTPPTPAPEAKAESPAPEAKAEDTDEKPPKMTVELVETPSTVEGAHGLAVTFEIEDGWHIYWTNPGESGLPTRVKFAGPEDSEFDEALYPLPETFVAPGDIQSYGYGHRTALFSSVRGVEKGDEVTAKASWLVCKASCIKQDAELSLKLGEKTTDAFEDLRKRVPAAFSEAPPSAPKWESADRNTTLTLTFSGEAPTRFIPASTDPFILESSTLEGQTLTLRWRRVAPSAPKAGQGVIVFGDEKNPRPYQLALDWPPTT